MKAFKAFIKPIEALQGSVKIKIKVNFLILSGIGMLRVKKTQLTDSSSVKNSFPHSGHLRLLVRRA